jgi:hypothetical protein
MTTTLNTTDAPARKVKVGDKVTVNDRKFPGVWTVTGLGPKNATLTPDHGGRGLRAPYYMLSDAVEGDVTVTAVPLPAYFAEGEIVRLNGGKFAGIYVVIKDSGADRVNVAKLGGDGGRYVRADKRSVTKVDPADVLK